MMEIGKHAPVTLGRAEYVRADLALPAVQPNAAAIREAALREALIGLLADIQDYQRINNLGGENNHSQVIARALINNPEGQQP
jgi:hypothetical protein